MSKFAVTEQTCRTQEHTTFYLAAGPEDGPLIIFCHGWPELSISWRNQLPFFAAMGFRAIAPDMRGYGRSSVYDTHDAYRQELIVGDMLALIDDLGREDAIWVGHDWGSPVVWNLVSQHPERCRGIASLCVPYATIEQGLDFIVGLVDREIYPEAEFPYGQWEYMRFYEENFDTATRPMDANPRNFVNLIFRKGSPEGEGKPAGTSMARKAGGLLGGASEPPWMPRDEDILGEVEASIYASGLKRNGLFGPNSWYMNHEANTEYYARAPHKVLELPVLFLHARYDYTCYTVKGRLAEPMRELCKDLTEEVVESGHWMAQEKPADVNRHLVRWMAGKNLL